MEWAKNCIVGCVLKKITASEIGELLHARGYDKTRVGRLSIDTWILVSETTEESSNILNEKRIGGVYVLHRLADGRKLMLMGGEDFGLTYMVSRYMFGANNFSEK